MITIQKALPIPSNGNFIAAAVLMGGEQLDIVQHAGIIIRYGDEYKVFHFGPPIIFENVTASWHFIKDLIVIDSRLTASIYNLCTKIIAQKPPQYGMLFDGAFWNLNGDFFSQSGMPHYSTCVGFCMSVLKGALYGVDFIQYTDWTVEDNFGVDQMGYAEQWIERIMQQNPSLDIEEVVKNIKRITPIEFFTASFSKAVPVNKEFVDNNKDIIKSKMIPYERT